MKWKIYFHNGKTYSDLDGPPEMAPCEGVQVIIQHNEQVERYYTVGADYYVWKPENNAWFGVDIMGFLLYMLTVGFKVMRPGILSTTEEYQEIIALVEADEDFPPKSGYLPGERRV